MNPVLVAVVRPIGVVDTARRIISKAVLAIVGPDIQDASGCQQLCGGQIAGIEAAVHATRAAFESEESQAALLVDATNFYKINNTLNRQLALHNIRRLCPPIATILINSYFMDGDTFCHRKARPRVIPLPWQ